MVFVVVVVITNFPWKVATLCVCMCRNAVYCINDDAKMASMLCVLLCSWFMHALVECLSVCLFVYTLYAVSIFNSAHLKIIARTIVVNN